MKQSHKDTLLGYMYWSLYLALFAAILYVAKPLLLICGEHFLPAYNSVFESNKSLPPLGLFESLGTMAAYGAVGFGITSIAWLAPEKIIQWVFRSSANASPKQ